MLYIQRLLKAPKPPALSRLTGIIPDTQMSQCDCHNHYTMDSERTMESQGNHTFQVFGIGLYDIPYRQQACQLTGWVWQCLSKHCVYSHKSFFPLSNPWFHCPVPTESENVANCSDGHRAFWEFVPLQCDFAPPFIKDGVYLPRGWLSHGTCFGQCFHGTLVKVMQAEAWAEPPQWGLPPLPALIHTVRGLSLLKDEIWTEARQGPELWIRPSWMVLSHSD